MSKKKNFPLRVIHVVSPDFGYTFSGTTKPILRLFQEWPISGIEISLWGTNYLEQGGGNADKFWSEAKRSTRSQRFLWALRLFWMLIQRRHDYDIVHMHVLPWGGLLTPLFTRLLGKKAIYHMTLLGADNPSAIARQSLGWLKLTLFRLYDGVIGLAPALVDDCRQQGFTTELLSLPSFLVFNPVTHLDKTRRNNRRKQLNIPENAHVLIFVGSIVARKGVDLLVDVFLGLADQRADLWLILAGAHNLVENPRLDEEFVAAQKTKLEQAGLNYRVVWTGLVRDETILIDTYLASDLFVFPTRAEGQGYVILESMGCGLPSICSDLPGVTDMMVIPGETGFLITVDDLAGFTDAIITLCDDPVLGQKMGQAGQERVTADFGFESYCRKLAQFYRQVAVNVDYESKST